MDIEAVWQHIAEAFSALSPGWLDEAETHLRKAAELKKPISGEAAGSMVLNSPHINSAGMFEALRGAVNTLGGWGRVAWTFLISLYSVFFLDIWLSFIITEHRTVDSFPQEAAAFIFFTAVRAGLADSVVGSLTGVPRPRSRRLGLAFLALAGVVYGLPSLTVAVLMNQGGWLVIVGILMDFPRLLLVQVVKRGLLEKYRVPTVKPFPVRMLLSVYSFSVLPLLVLDVLPSYVLKVQQASGLLVAAVFLVVTVVRSLYAFFVVGRLLGVKRTLVRLTLAILVFGVPLVTLLENVLGLQVCTRYISVWYFIYDILYPWNLQLLWRAVLGILSVAAYFDFPRLMLLFGSQIDEEVGAAAS